MSAPEFSLLGKRRFGPLFVVQFLGVFNDNLLKFALLFLANFQLYKAEPETAEMLATLATGVFIAPYFLFSALAGQVADAWDKAQLVRIVKGAEVLIMVLALAGFWTDSVPVLLLALFLMGLHSTISEPVKYAILPQHLHENEVMGGTSLIEAGIFLAVLGGQLLAGVVQPWQAGLVATALAVLGFLAALFVPSAPAAAPGLRIERNVFSSTWHILKLARHGRGVWLSILGTSWFYAGGAILVSEFAPLVVNVLNARQEVATLFLLIFSVGVALGSLLVNKLLKGEVSARYVPVSALCLSGFMIDLWLSTRAFTPSVLDAGIAAFTASSGSWRIIADLVGISFSGGMFIVPLYAILQTHCPAEERSRTIAANNIVNAVVAVLAVAVVTALLADGAGVPGVIGAMGFATLAVALVSCWLLPDTVIKAVARAVLCVLHRVEVTGAENMPRRGEPAIVAVNRASWLDRLLLAAFLPGKPAFVVHNRVVTSWWVRPFLSLFDAIAVDPANPMAGAAIVKAAREGRTFVVFPEGRIAETGAQTTVLDAPSMVADMADAPIIPVRIEGEQDTPISSLKGRVRALWSPKIHLTILRPVVSLSM